MLIHNTIIYVGGYFMNKKDEILHIRISKEVKDVIKEKCEKEEITISRYIMDLIKVDLRYSRFYERIKDE